VTSSILPLLVGRGNGYRERQTDVFSVYCPRHGHHVLLSASSIVGLERGAHGLTAHLECYCGEQLTVAPAQPRTALSAV
jgi:hypothetical protein